MKYFLILTLLTTMSISQAQDGKATTIKKTFSRATSVSIKINATPEKVWKLLTDAANMPNWNSTVISIEGDIKVGEKIKLKSYLDPRRTFKIKIKEMQKPNKMVWGDAMGNRVFTIQESGESVIFSMDEKIGGLMFPLFANKIPSFDESFEKYAADLKKAAEST